MNAQSEITAADGTPEVPLPESLVLTSREDDIPDRFRRVIQGAAAHGPELMEPCS